MPLSSLRRCLGFLSLLPVGMSFRSYGEVARDAWMFPAAGATLGVLAGAAGLLALFFLPKSIAAAVALLVLLLLTGFHHLDGLLDTADAAMRRGSVEERLRAMHDVNHGVAAFGAGFFVLLLSYLALYEAEGLLTSLIVGEASAKFAMVVSCYVAGRASHPGMGEEFIRALGGNHRAMALCLAVYLPFLALAWGDAPLVLGVVLLTALSANAASERLFGGVSGDVLGAVNEVSRLLAMLVLV
ncbi:MAG: adenosylcobinamide-GDP ribazoletransferase [Euryarchaeota archaeon]|nr:adenosylcobinamide-GDP ribazoletransferase [Euryarchaeota archaeon]